MEEKKSSNSMIWIIGIVVVLLLIGGGVYFKNMQSSNNTVTEDPTLNATPVDMSSPSDASTDATDSGTAQGTTKEFTIEGSNFKFAPSVLTVNKGDTVKITFNNTGGMHDFVIDDFNVQTKTIQSGATDTVTFVADKTGSFEYYCSVGNHRQMGMTGTLTVQ